MTRIALKQNHYAITFYHEGITFRYCEVYPSIPSDVSARIFIVI